ncbi:hypothetical protein GALMADRAFT_238766 [Galerina marginata CBS 339.88]|uniref:Uncharacterized protein n=1 Tax=Galerina marginata (strain CBS 339.88) TaxID=685588 RepID=A0A067TVJ7_GALM3|nr:hypothetical protein GALMADRAFT_238766 [Galerina marginata CBS 339.88]
MNRTTVTDRLRKTEARKRPSQPGRSVPSPTKARLEGLAQRRAGFLAETGAHRSSDTAPEGNDIQPHFTSQQQAHITLTEPENTNIIPQHGLSHDMEQLHSSLAALSMSKARRQGFPPAVTCTSTSPEFYDTSRFYIPTTLSQVASSALVSSFNALASNLFCGTPLKLSAANLAASKQIRQLTLVEARGLGGTTPMDEKCVDSSPADIRTVYRMFETLDPKLTVYACCPISGCSTIYPPIEGERGVLEYPVQCSQVKFGKTCGEMLVKDCAVVNGQSTPRPLKPYSYHHFNDHVAAMLSRPSIEEAIESYARTGGLEAELTDIISSQVLRGFQDASGRPFLRDDGSELCLVWAFAADWFNPHSNKASGKAVSTGVMAMICLSLPPTLRYLEENIYLVGVIPGPREPALDAINHFMTPLMHDLKASYECGVYYSRTFKHSAGRTSFSCVIPVIADTLASKKVTGHCGHGGKYFCSRCRLPRSEIDNVDPSSWPPGLTRAEHEAHAETWRAACNKSRQESLVKAHGVRWSALLLLPYWQPSDWSITEGVHVLLLGVTARHCRDLLGLNFGNLPQEDDDESPSLERMEHARRVFANGSPSQLHKLNIDALKQLCIEGGLSLPPRKKGRRSKKVYIAVLLDDSSTVPRSSDDDFDLGTFFDGHLKEAHISPTSLKKTSGGNSGEDDLASTPPEVITQQTLMAIRKHIEETLRPDWQAHLPADFGSPAHGKLKADQWRTALEFDIPVSLVQVLASHKSTGNVEEDARLHQVVEHTFDLAMALAWGLSRRTSKFHAERYSFYMQRYLIGIQTLFPEYNLKPNHHYALHISDILILFGPLHGTWAFSLERLIGRLQKLNTNSKIGDMENTAMHMFCRRSNFIRLMESPDCPSSIVEAWSTFRSRLDLGDLDRGFPCPKRSTEAGICSGRIQGTLDCEIQQKFESKFRPRNNVGPRVYFNPETAQRFRSYECRSLRYTDFQTSEKHSLVYFATTSGVKSKDGANLYPGQIRQIFQHSHLVSGTHLFTDIFIAIHVYIPVEMTKNPFAPFVDFRAAIFHLDPSPVVEVIRASQIQCHANQRPWDSTSVVMRAIDRDY